MYIVQVGQRGLSSTKRYCIILYWIIVYCIVIYVFYTRRGPTHRRHRAGGDARSSSANTVLYYWSLYVYTYTHKSFYDCITLTWCCPADASDKIKKKKRVHEPPPQKKGSPPNNTISIPHPTHPHTQGRGGGETLRMETALFGVREKVSNRAVKRLREAVVSRTLGKNICMCMCGWVWIYIYIDRFVHGTHKMEISYPYPYPSH